MKEEGRHNMEISEKLKDAIMTEVANRLDVKLDAEEYEFSVHLYVELHHAEMGIKVGGRDYDARDQHHRQKK